MFFISRPKHIPFTNIRALIEDGYHPKQMVFIRLRPSFLIRKFHYWEPQLRRKSSIHPQSIAITPSQQERDIPGTKHFSPLSANHTDYVAFQLEKITPSPGRGNKTINGDCFLAVFLGGYKLSIVKVIGLLKLPIYYGISKYQLSNCGSVAHELSYCGVSPVPPIFKTPRSSLRDTFKRSSPVSCLTVAPVARQLSNCGASPVPYFQNALRPRTHSNFLLPPESWRCRPLHKTKLFIANIALSSIKKLESAGRGEDVIVLRSETAGWMG